METPVLESPFKIACCIGEEPLYFGKIEGCILIEPNLGILIISSGNILNATTTNKSALRDFKKERKILHFKSSTTLTFGEALGGGESIMIRYLPVSG